MREQQRLGKPLVLAPEYNKASVGISYIRVSVLCLCSEEIALPGAFSEKVLKALVVAYIEVMPVIKPRAFEMLVRRFKAHRLYDMQPGAGNRAGTGDISRVLRDPRLCQNDIQFRVDSPPLTAAGHE